MDMQDEQKLSFDCFRPLKCWTCLPRNLASVDQYTFFQMKKSRLDGEAWVSLSKRSWSPPCAQSPDWLWKARDQANGWVFILLSPECKEGVWKQRSNTVTLRITLAAALGGEVALYLSIWKDIEGQTPSMCRVIPGAGGVPGCLQHRVKHQAQQNRWGRWAEELPGEPSPHTGRPVGSLVFLNDQNTAQKWMPTNKVKGSLKNKWCHFSPTHCWVKICHFSKHFIGNYWATLFAYYRTAIHPGENTYCLWASWKELLNTGRENTVIISLKQEFANNFAVDHFVLPNMGVK